MVTRHFLEALHQIYLSNLIETLANTHYAGIINTGLFTASCLFVFLLSLLASYIANVMQQHADSLGA